MNYICGKTALITGAGDGIGRACALGFSALGASVILVGRNEQKLRTLADECERVSGEFFAAGGVGCVADSGANGASGCGLNSNLTANIAPNAQITPVKQSPNAIKHAVKPEIFLLDVRDKDRVFKEFSAFAKTRQIDILINNAGLALGLEPLDEGDTLNWEVMIDTNVKGLLYVTRALLPQMRQLPTAHIVNLGSVAGKTAYPSGNVYCATKAAVRQLGECLNADLFGTNVKVTTIAPGAVETEFSRTRFKGDESRASATYEGYTPLYADDIADAIISVVNTKPNVNIQYLDIMPIAQRNPYMVYRQK